MHHRHHRATVANSPPHGFTVCELLVVISCIGVLLSLLLPAVIHAREAARRTTCCIQLRELGIAVHAYHDRQRKFPTAWRSLTSQSSFVRGWATELLPELGEESVGELLRTPSTAMRQLSNVSLPILLCPSDITEPTFQLLPDEDVTPLATVTAARATDEEKLSGMPMTLPTASYVGVYGTTEADEQDPRDVDLDDVVLPSDGTIVHDRRVRMADLERGTSKTLLVGERTMATVPSTWLGVNLAGEDAQCRLVGSAITRPNCDECDECEFSSRHSGGANFLWADGHVELIGDDVETTLYRQYSQRFAR